MQYDNIMADAVNDLGRHFTDAEVIEITKITIIPQHTESTQYGPVLHKEKVVYEGTATFRYEKIEFFIKKDF